MSTSNQRLALAGLLTCLLLGCKVPQLQALPATTAAAGVTLGAISGQVQLPAGVDASRLAVWVYPANAKPGDSPYTSGVDATGHFSVQAPLGGDYTVVVQDQQNKLSGLIRHVLDGGTTAVSVDLTPNGGAHGNLEQSSGGAAVGVWVYVPGTNLVAITDNTGAYAFGNLPVGSQPLMAEGLGFVSQSLGNVTVTAGGTAAVAQATLTNGALTGVAGQPGINGSSLSTGTTAPTGGALGDTYLNTTTGDLSIFGVGGWVVSSNLAGNAGLDGPAGVPAGPALPGTNGTTGTNGSQFLGGVGVPTLAATDGDTYLDEVTGNLYLRKPPGTWALVGNLRGAVTLNGGNVSTMAGVLADATEADGTGAAALFSGPTQVAVDAAGKVYVTDATSGKVREIAPGAVVTTLAPTFNQPSGIAVDAAGDIFVAESSRHDVQEIVAGTSVAVLFAGSPAGLSGLMNGTGAAALFNTPESLAIDSTGNLFVADFGNEEIRQISPAGVVTTFAGTGVAGAANGPSASATFSGPYGIAVDSRHNVYVADSLDNEVREISSVGMVSTFAGNSINSQLDGLGSAATFSGPQSLAVDASGNVYVADLAEVRAINAEGLVTTLAGHGVRGSTDGQGAAAAFGTSFGLAVDAGQNLYVADTNNQTIRLVR